MFKCGYYKSLMSFHKISHDIRRNMSGLGIHGADQWPASIACHYNRSNPVANCIEFSYGSQVYRKNRKYFGEIVKFNCISITTSYKDVLNRLNNV